MNGSLRSTAGFLCALSIAGCAGVAAAPQTAPPPGAAERPIPYPVTQPPDFEWAIQQGTRTTSGAPGRAYWQQWARYDLTARLLHERKVLEGRGTITYYNRSPDTLNPVFLQLIQNLHKPGALRLEEVEVTGGVVLRRVAVDGLELTVDADSGPRYLVDGTRMGIVLPEPLAPRDSVTIGLDWSFTIPARGAGERMGWNDDNLFFLAYWYPQMAVYDDVVGWQIDPFRSNAEFYAGFGSYDVTVEAPAGWLVHGTGALQNPEEVLRPEIVQRMRLAERSDSIVHVVAAADSGRVTRTDRGPWLTWRFRADSVRDVAFSATRASRWDAARTPVGDRDGDGRTDYARVDAVWRASAPRWAHVARYAQHSIDFLSRYTGLPYPWPHMTAVEGGGIIGGGMEFPMMTLMGDYNARGDSALYYVTAHELAHMWVPMMLSNDERRRAWMDEGTTSFNENQARMEFFPGVNHNLPDQETYLQLARFGGEGEILRWSDFHYTGAAYSIASYAKPASVLVALRGVLGEETFSRAYRMFLRRWAFKHPYPWDLFHTFESVSGRDLSWFWRTWYYETWTLDHAVASVESTEGGTRIVVEDRGWAPMPVHLAITREDGTVVRREVSVERWLGGATRAVVEIPGGSTVVRVEIDPERHFPDLDRENNVWER